MPWRSCSRKMLEVSVIRNMIHIIQMLVPSRLCRCLTISPMLMPMKKIGTRLQKISRWPTAWWMGVTYCTRMHHMIMTTGNQR